MQRLKLTEDFEEGLRYKAKQGQPYHTQNYLSLYEIILEEALKSQLYEMGVNLLEAAYNRISDRDKSKIPEAVDALIKAANVPSKGYNLDAETVGNLRERNDIKNLLTEGSYGSEWSTARKLYDEVLTSQGFGKFVGDLIIELTRTYHDSITTQLVEGERYVDMAVFAYNCMQKFGQIDSEQQKIFRPFITKAAELTRTQMGINRGYKRQQPQELTNFAVELTSPGYEAVFMKKGYQEGYRQMFAGLLPEEKHEG